MALFTGIAAWVVFLTGMEDPHIMQEELTLKLGEIAEILFFLMGAMTIIEIIDSHQGFNVITNRIRTSDRRVLLWMVSLITFFLSALLDNLTTSIVMVSLLGKMIDDKQERMFYAGMVVIAANAGGAWSPIGDVTTTMLWIGGQITTFTVIQKLFLPSLVCLIVPLLIASRKVKGELHRREKDYSVALKNERVKGSRRMLWTGIGALVFVPIFKTVTHLPPYMGMLLGLSIVWILSEVIHIDKDEEAKKPYSAVHALTKIDAPSILFFLGILMAVGALEAAHILEDFALGMDKVIGNLNAIVMSMGLLSSIVDNVPLVAATMAMYSMEQFPTDHFLWEFTAYCAGTGGSLLIIGSVSGVAVMGLAKIKFGWYFRKISFLALIGYLAGAGFILLKEMIL